MEWVAISFSRGSCQPSDWTWLSCTAGWLLTIWTTYNNNVTGTSANLRSCWTPPKKQMPLLPSLYAFGTCGTQRESQLSRFSGLLRERPYVQVSSLSGCSLHTGLQDTFPSKVEEWNKMLTGIESKTACNAAKDWRQEEKGMTEDKMVGWHHWLNGHEFEQAPADGEGQGSLLTCCMQSMGSQRVGHDRRPEKQPYHIYYSEILNERGREGKLPRKRLIHSIKVMTW